MRQAVEGEELKVNVLRLVWIAWLLFASGSAHAVQPPALEVGIVDACESGAILLKGGRPTRPFRLVEAGPVPAEGRK